MKIHNQTIRIHGHKNKNTYRCLPGVTEEKYVKYRWGIHL
jgi:hypothetical protein